ncbi:response regulator [Phormidium tenue FACHB-886]|nr:response regulator [Phormidium tenue FACHB-886]
MASQKVLIVDDSKVIRMQVREMLPKGSFEVLEAGDGIEGLEVINRESLSLILIDFFMPRMNGWEVVQKLQDHPKHKSVPIVMMSGRREEVEQAARDQFNYFEFVSKPFEQPSLVQAIKGAMAKARSRQQAVQPTRQPVGQSTGQPSGQPAISIAKPASPIASSTSANPDIQTLQAELRSLRQENTQLRTEVDTLKTQVAQIMAFIRQRLK